MIKHQLKHEGIDGDTRFGVSVNHEKKLVLVQLGEGLNEIRVAMTPEEALKMERLMRVMRLKIHKESKNVSKKCD